MSGQQEPNGRARQYMALRRGRLGIVGVLLAALMLAGFGGTWGVVAGTVLLGVGFVLPALAVFAAGHLLVLVGLPAVGSLEALLIGAGLFAVIAEEFRDGDAAGWPMLVAWGVFLGMMTGIAVAFGMMSAGLVAVGIAGVAAACLYAVHRYVRVGLGLARPTRTTEVQTTDD